MASFKSHVRNSISFIYYWLFKSTSGLSFFSPLTDKHWLHIELSISTSSNGIETKHNYEHNSTTTMVQTVPFRFLDLPPELRNTIYTIYLTNQPAIRIPDRRRYKLPDILLTNKQIHQESKLLFYNLATFKVLIRSSLHMNFGRLPAESLDAIRDFRICDVCADSRKTARMNFKFYRAYIERAGVRLRLGSLWQRIAEGTRRLVWVNELGERKELDDGDQKDFG